MARPGPSSDPPPGTRHYGMDWLRIGVFQLLILYHVGMAFVPWRYEIKVVSPPIDWVAIPMLLTNAWRLSLLFAVSGYASAALLAREPRAGAFVRARLDRLGLPLLFAMAVLVTPQPWVALVTQHGYAHGFGWFLAHDYYRFHVIAGIAMPTWMHLWFVAYLLAYTLVLGAVAALPRLRAGLRRAGERLLAGPALLPLPIAWIYVARGAVSPGWIETHALWGDWSAHLVYLFCFLFGALLHRSPPLRHAIERQWPWAAALALTAYAVIAAAEFAYPGDTLLPPMLGMVFLAARATQVWSAIVALIGVAERYWNVDGRYRAVLAEAVFPFYIIHQTLILLIGYALLQTSTGALVRFVVLVLGTSAGCWLFYLAGRAVPWLRPLIGLRRRAAVSPAEAGA